MKAMDRALSQKLGILKLDTNRMVHHEVLNYIHIQMRPIYKVRNF